MKGQTAKIFIRLFFTLLFAAPAAAQTTRPAEFHIPFDFVIRGRSFPAGTYTVARLDYSKPEVLIMRNSDGRARRIFFTQRIEAGDYNEGASLVFNIVGDEHLLSQVWGVGERSGRQLPEVSSTSEKGGKPVAVIVMGSLTK